jgi:hypothetical protein
VLTTWVGRCYYWASADLVLTGDGYWIRMTDFDAPTSERAQKQHFDDLDTFLDALKAISPKWYANRWICFTSRDVELYRATENVLWHNHPAVTDYTGLLQRQVSKLKPPQQLELF